MKVISFFSRLTAICNICFLIFIFLAKLEASKQATDNNDKVMPVPYLKDIVITLGISAILINLIMCVVYAVVVITGRQKLLPKWLVIVNFLFLIFQFVYFFLR